MDRIEDSPFKESGGNEGVKYQSSPAKRRSSKSIYEKKKVKRGGMNAVTGSREVENSSRTNFLGG